MKEKVDTLTMSREDAVKFYVDEMGLDEDTANFIVGLERGENNGDLIEVKDE